MGMLSRAFLLAIILTLLPCWSASAQERTVIGEVSAVPMGVDVKGSRAKFNEYRDIRDGVSGNIGLRYDGGKDYFDFRAGDIGRRDQKYELEGGSRGNFNFHLDYDKIPHNFTLGNRPSP
jgi:Putative outer membrane beta-barrel porin, MtrB/PioB